MKTNLLLNLILLLLSWSLNAQEATVPIGSGTFEDPYKIASLNNLYWLSTNSTAWNKHFIQTADIDASASSDWNNWAGFGPIGNRTNRFTGSYDGQGYYIKNLTIERFDYYDDGLGMFGGTSNAKLERIGLIDVSIESDRQYVGGLVGEAANTEIHKSYVTGQVTGVATVGGLVGNLVDNSTIDESYTSCNVTGSEYVGGLVGVNQINSSITNSYATGNVSGNFRVGGLVGFNNYLCNISKSYSTSLVSGTTNIGGLVGINDGGIVTNSFWDTETSLQATSAGGTGKTTTEMKTQSTFTDWDFATIWGMDASVNDGYPNLEGKTSVLTASVSIEANPAGSVCQGTSVTFTATPVNGGTPTYQWMKNGTAVEGETVSTFTTDALADNDAIAVVMTSSLSNVTGSPATSNTIVADVISLPVVPGEITGPATVCAGGIGINYSVAAVTDATSYNWTLPEGAEITSGSGTNSITVTFGSTSGTVSVTASNSCGTTSQSTKTITVNPSFTPTVTIASSDDNNIICADTEVIFTATPHNTGGGTVSYGWFYNETYFELNRDWWASTELRNGDKISCEITVTGGTCLTKDKAVSKIIVNEVYDQSDPSVTIESSVSGTFCPGTMVNFTAIPVSLGGTVAYQWKWNDRLVGSNQNMFTSAEFKDGDRISCDITVTDAACFDEKTASSNELTVSVYDSPEAGSINGTSELCPGYTVTFSITGNSIPGSWFSSNESVAIVDQSGNVTAVDAGSATIGYSVKTTDPCMDSDVAEFDINVYQFIARITGFTEIGINGTTYLSPSTGGTWISSNPAVATVTDEGIVTGIAAGTATFTYTAASGCIATTGELTVKSEIDCITPVATAPAVGDGSSEHPFEIATLENLYWIKTNSSAWDKYFIQTADIDASSTAEWCNGGWSPIGYSDNYYFIIHYDGNHHVISNLHIKSTSGTAAGLFGAAENSEFKNLGITDVYIDAVNADHVGALLGWGIFNVVIDNCYSTGAVKGHNYCGGLAGYLDNYNSETTIRNSYSTCNVSGNDFVGGLVGYCHHDVSVLNSYHIDGIVEGNKVSGGLIGWAYRTMISKCYSTGNVTGNSGDGTGGLVGSMFNSGINNSYSRCTITNTSTTLSCGGLVGFSSSQIDYPSIITNCYSTGPVQAGMGGLVGRLDTYGTTTITNSFWDTETSGTTTSAGGTGKSTTQMKMESTFIDAGWDFVNVWGIFHSCNDGYPYLRQENLRIPLVTITSDVSGEICSGINPIFTATPTNTGVGNVSYSWKLNGNSVGLNQNPYTLIDAIPGYVYKVSCEITVTDPASCTSATASSDTIIISVTPFPDAGLISVVDGGDNEIEVGEQITLNSTLSGGMWDCKETDIAYVDLYTGQVTGLKAGTATINYYKEGIESTCYQYGVSEFPITVTDASEINTQTFTSSGTFIVPDGVYSLDIKAWGGGGGGSYRYTDNTDPDNPVYGPGAGGGGGGFCRGTISVTPGDLISVAVGTGGSGGYDDSGNGDDGESSVIEYNDIIIEAWGGYGGESGPDGGIAGDGNDGWYTGEVINPVKYFGGNGAVGFTSEEYGAGGAGGGGAGDQAQGGDASGDTGGLGGNSGGGNGGSSGESGLTYSGGGGGVNANDNSSGGDGAGGAVIIEWMEKTCTHPVPTFTDYPTSPQCAGVDVTYTTQADKTNYVWNIQGTEDADYEITSGGTSSDNTVTLTWLTAGSKTLTVNYTEECAGITPASSTITVNPLPEATFAATASNTPICEGENATFYLTGTANAVVSYSITDIYGVTTGTATLSSTGEATVVVISAFKNQTMLLKSVQDLITGCTQTLSATEVVQVKQLPFASFDSPASNNPVCSGENALFYVTGTPGSRLTFHIEGNADNTIRDLDETGKLTVTIENVTSDISVELISVEYPDGLCTVGLDNASSTVIVNPEPVVSITGNTTINVGGTTNLSPAEGGKWESNNPAVAMVDVAGEVTGVSAGTATFTFTDAITGCSATTEAATVLDDNIPPVAKCQNVTVSLDENGTGAKTAELVDNGSTDDSGIKSLALSQTDFDCFNLGSNTVTLTVTDIYDNAATCQATVTVEDKILPTFTSPANTTVYRNASCEYNASPSITGDVTDEADNCGVGQAVYSDYSENSDRCFMVIERTWTLTDNAGNIAESQVQRIYVKDVTPPVIQQAEHALDATVECSDGKALHHVLDDMVPTATDNCIPANKLYPILKSDISTTDPVCPNGYYRTRTWYFHDDCGNRTDDYVQVIHVVDTKAPMLKNPLVTSANLDISGVNVCLGTAAQWNATILEASVAALYTDNCDSEVSATLTGEPVPGTNNYDCSWSFTYTFTVADNCGNDVTCTVTRSGGDIEDPQWEQIMPANITVECDEVPLVPTISATDNCDANVDVQFSENRTDGSCPNSYTLIRKWTATDNCLRSITHTQVITVKDTEAPFLVDDEVTPASLNISGINECLGTAVQWDASVLEASVAELYTDNCDAEVSATLTGEPVTGTNNSDCSWSFTYTFTVADNCGNDITCTVTRSGGDTEKPEAKCKNIIVQLDANSEATISEDAVNNESSDNCSSALSFDTDITSFGCSNVGANTVVLTVTDNCNLSSTCNATVTVQDKIAPVITCSADITQPADAGKSYATITVVPPTVTDCDNHVLPVSNNELIRNGNFNAGDSYWENCGNTAEINTEEFYIVSVPMPAPSSNKVAEVDKEVSLCQEISGFTVGNKYVLTFKATRRQNTTAPNSVSANVIIDGGALSQVVTRTNTTFDLTPESFIFTATQETHKLTFTPSAGNTSTLGLVVDDISVRSITYPVGTTTLVWTATDVSGNTATCEQHITVADNEPPTFTAPDDVTIQCSDDPDDLTLTGDVTDEADNFGFAVDANQATYSDDESGLTGCNGTGSITRTWSLTDATGITTTHDQIITVQDNTNPTATAPAGDDLECAADLPDAATTIADFLALDNVSAAADNCTATVNLTVSHSDAVTAAGNCSGAITRTYTITDGCNNSIDVYQVFTVTDNTPPTAICKDIEVTLGQDGTVTIEENAVNNGSFDNCTSTSNLEFDTDVTSFDCTKIGLNNVEMTVTDECGNSSIGKAVVKVLPYTAATEVSVLPNAQQYSDKATFTATVTPASVKSGCVAATHVTFWVGTQQMGQAVELTNGTASIDYPLTELPSWPSNGQMAPGSHGVKAVFSGTDPAFIVPEASTNLVINPEDVIIDYIGTEIVGEANPDVSTTPVALRATITDNNVDDINRGDIRNARVRFEMNGSPISGWLEPTLVNPADLTQGIVSYVWNAPVPSTGYATYDITVNAGDNGYYKGSLDDVPVTVYRTSLNEFITGGGHIIPVDSKGEYASDPGRKVNFGFNVKWNKTMKNLQGNFNLILRRGSEIYQIKTNALSGLGIDGSNPCSHKAVLTAKANLNRVTGGITETIMGNLILQVTLTDNGEPGVVDMIGVTLYNGSTLLYSSNWPVSSTEELTLVGGNIVVNDGLICNASDITHTVITSDKNPSLTGEEVTFTATVYGHDATPQGTLVFSINGETFAGTLDSKGSTTVDYSFDEAGTYEIKADYISTNGYKPSTGTITQLVHGSSFILSSSKNPSVSGDEVTFTAVLNSPDAAPAGTVTFKVDGEEKATDVPLVDKKAIFTTNLLSSGSHTIEAVYTSTNVPSIVVAPATLTQVVNDVSISLASSKNPSVIAETVVFTATVTGSASIGETVTFFKDGAEIGTATVDVSGNATVFYPFGTAGTYVISAECSGKSVALSQVVSKPVIALVSSLNPSAENEDVTFTATVTGASEGTVRFTNGTDEYSTILTDGKATWTIPLAEGSYLIKAEYYISGTLMSEASLTQVVTADNITVELVSSKPLSVVYGTNITYTATVKGSVTTPSGTITFKDGTTVLKNVLVSGGKASFSTNKLSVGYHPITATYNLTGTVSDTIKQTVTAKTKSAEIATALVPEVELADLKVYPNPFSERLRFELVSPEPVNARIDLYDMTGRLVKTIFEQPVEGGIHYNAEFWPDAMVSAMYIYRVTLGEAVYNGKVVFKKE